MTSHSKLGLFLVVCFLSCHLFGQNWQILQMTWDHDPTEWQILDSNDTEVAALYTLNQFEQRKITWEFDLANESARLTNVYPNQFDAWSLHSATNTIHMQSVHKGRWEEWRISNGNYTLTLKANRLADPLVWFVDHPTYGYFEVFSTFEGDPREWQIIDELINVPWEMKAALIYIPIWVNFGVIGF